jgi:hypothetical protein
LSPQLEQQGCPGVELSRAGDPVTVVNITVSGRTGAERAKNPNPASVSLASVDLTVIGGPLKPIGRAARPFDPAFVSKWRHEGYCRDYLAQ